MSYDLSVSGLTPLSQSDQGYQVRVLQALLNLNDAELEVTGVFDHDTRIAVLRYQRLNSIEDIPGIVDDATWARLLGVSS